MPEEFKIYFWDTEFEQLDIKKNMKYIMSRLLTEGDMRTFKWIRSTYEREEIIETEHLGTEESVQFNNLIIFVRLTFKISDTVFLGIFKSITKYFNNFIKSPLLLAISFKFISAFLQ